MKKLWNKHKRFLAPLFVAYEVVMHSFILLYLVTHHAALLAVGGMSLELVMYFYLLFTKGAEASHHHPTGFKNLCDGCPYEGNC